ncbi:hypothetical protein MVEN_01342100 [Mycena venus]|uniref:HCP-like protein n=1 Tax=Mycena venus TaxID=2733690 RepID=A0A8H6Y1R8_9AGAR|nr:hypothetical protein MVEN_01342100 [Mycena venus]
MSLPPVPPRPPTTQPQQQNSYQSAPALAFSPPHFDDPLAAPRPHRVDPSLSANIARDLDNTMAQQLNPGFIQPNQNRTPSPLPPPGGEWSPWAGVGTATPGPGGRTPSPMPPARLPSPPRDGSLTVPLPSIPALTAALSTVTAPSHDPQLQLAWARDVLFLVDRTPSLSSSPLALAAAPLILTLASTQPPLPEAVYLRATFASAGTYPNLLPANPRGGVPVRVVTPPPYFTLDFEAAARAGHAPAWFRLARDYEAFNDTAHAIDCLNRGAKARDPAALHRLGTAHLLGQLGLTADAPAALPYLHQAAAKATLQCPQPAYVFALILLGEFTTPVPVTLLSPYLPPGQSRESYARSMLERAAALHFAPAQYKLGHAFEFAVPASAFPFDPLLSVQWYSLASQAGEAEADMALSKWFLCGAEGAFDKDEGLARTFAAKAATKGLPSGEFAMGYYNEVGIGGGLDLAEARSWYGKAAAHGNTDASERLRALAQSVPQALSRTEHDALTGDKLVRKRTQARMRSDREGTGADTFTAEPGQYVNPHPEGPLPDPYGASSDPYGAGPAGRATAPPSAYRNNAYGAPQQQDPAQRRTRVMELARKSSLADSGHYRSASAGGFDYRAGAGSAPPQGPPPGAGPGGYGAPNAYGAQGSGPGRGRMPPVAEQQGMGRGGGQGREGSLPPPQAQQRMGPPREGSLPPGRQGTPSAGRGYTLSDTGSRPGSVAGECGVYWWGRWRRGRGREGAGGRRR